MPRVQTKAEFVQVWPVEDKNEEFPPRLKVGRQRQHCQQQRMSLSYHTHPLLLVDGKLQDVAVLYQRTLPDVTVGTTKKTSSVWTPGPDSTSPGSPKRW